MKVFSLMKKKTIMRIYSRPAWGRYSTVTNCTNTVDNITIGQLWTKENIQNLRCGFDGLMPSRFNGIPSDGYGNGKTSPKA